MNPETASEIRALFRNGTPLTDIMRRLLDGADADSRGRMELLAKLKQIFDFPLVAFSDIGAWNYWKREPDEGPGFDDDTVNRLTAGQFTLKAADEKAAP